MRKYRTIICKICGEISFLKNKVPSPKPTWRTCHEVGVGQQSHLKIRYSRGVWLVMIVYVDGWEAGKKTTNKAWWMDLANWNVNIPVHGALCWRFMLIFGSTLGSSKWDESYNYKHDQGQNFEMFQSISLLFLIKRQIFLLAVLLQPVSCVSQFCVLVQSPFSCSNPTSPWCIWLSLRSCWSKPRFRRPAFDIPSSIVLKSSRKGHSQL